MKRNLLQRRALTALFILLLNMVGMKKAFAQTQVATLQHGDDISAFYGANAFVEAHAAATDGDIVTLSSGSFNVPNEITKAISLRGAGVVSDSLAGTAPTVFTQFVKIDVSNDTIPFQVEGILFANRMVGAMHNPKFTKCSFNGIDFYSSSNAIQNAQFVNCMIKDFNFSSTTNTTIINSVVWNAENINDNHTVSFYNSIFRHNQNACFTALSAFNSVIIECKYQWVPKSTCSFFNCIGINVGSNFNPFGEAYTSGCTSYSSYVEVFKTFAGTFSLEEPFVLKDEIATGFLGSDGTQVGIHGGFMPYSNRPSYMVLKRCKVANKSTIDGKLSVEIEVITEE